MTEVPGGPGTPSAPGRPGLPGGPCRREREMLGSSGRVSYIYLFSFDEAQLQLKKCLRVVKYIHARISLSNSGEVLTLSPGSPTEPGGPEEPGGPVGPLKRREK